MTQSLEDIVFAGQGPQDAVPLGEGIFMSRGIANCYLVTSGDGDVMINTGIHYAAEETKARFARMSSGPLRHIVFTQGHPDHVGGWSYFDAPGVETIAQANHADVREYWRSLHPFYARRIAKLWGRASGADRNAPLPPEPVLTTAFVDAHAFERGGRQLELYATPGGETTDALVVWMPQERIVFIGNLLGPMFGHVPNLYTIRGDKIRSAMTFVHSVDRVIALEPETLINGHGVFRDADEIRATLTLVRDAVEDLRNQTIEGMNVGTDLWTLMREVTPRPEHALPQMHGKVPWIVRAIWEEHTGWFRYDSTTELYDVPTDDVWSDLVELAGVDALTARARAYVDAARPLHALHLTDMVLATEPTDAAALGVARAALELLLVASGRENYSEVQWLEQEIAAIDALLG